jgi:hypothetical protein
MADKHILQESGKGIDGGDRMLMTGDASATARLIGIENLPNLMC